METRLGNDRKKIEDEWFDEELPIGIFGIVLASILLTVLLGFTFTWPTAFEGFQKAILLLGFAVYLGRQMADIPWIYLVTSYKERYQTLAERKRIAYDQTKHVVRTIFLVVLGATLYFFHEQITLFWSVPVLILFFVLPIFYRILANKAKQRVDEKVKKEPVLRVSADGEIDLSHLPFVFENLEKHEISDQQVKKAYKNIQSLLDYVTMRVAFIDDIEVVHTLKRMGEEELPRLLRDYETLELDLQGKYSEKMLEYLQLIEAKLQTYREMIDAKHTQNIHTTFSLLDERYRG